MTSHEIFTPSSLRVVLQAIQEAKSEQDCAHSLVSAATLLQDAILRGQSPESVGQALESCPESLAGLLHETLSRAVDFHVTEEGTLGLWLLPVIVEGSQVPAVLPLAKSLDRLKVTAAINTQLSLGDDESGWAYMLPALYASPCLRNADIGELIRLPRLARETIRGQEPAAMLRPDGADESHSGTIAMFLPLVVKHPANRVPNLPAESERVVHFLTRLLHASLPDAEALNVQVATRPHPFSVALRVGDHMALERRVRKNTTALSEKTGVALNGMNALVAPYAVAQCNGDISVGVSLTSRMTGQPLATMAIPVESATGEAEAALVSSVLRSLGMEHVHLREEAIGTFACQHCGGMQFAMPAHQDGYTPSGTLQ